MPTTTNLEFNPWDRRRCTKIEIVSSSQVEAVESFGLLLQSSEDNINLSPQIATVDIVDYNSGKCPCFRIKLRGQPVTVYLTHFRLCRSGCGGRGEVHLCGD